MMSGSIVGVYNGKVFTQVRLDMMNNPVKSKGFCPVMKIRGRNGTIIQYVGSK